MNLGAVFRSKPLGDGKNSHDFQTGIPGRSQRNLGYSRQKLQHQAPQNAFTAHEPQTHI